MRNKRISHGKALGGMFQRGGSGELQYSGRRNEATAIVDIMARVVVVHAFQTGHFVYWFTHSASNRT